MWNTLSHGYNVFYDERLWWTIGWLTSFQQFICNYEFMEIYTMSTFRDHAKKAQRVSVIVIANDLQWSRTAIVCIQTRFDAFSLDYTFCLDAFFDHIFLNSRHSFISSLFIWLGKSVHQHIVHTDIMGGKVWKPVFRYIMGRSFPRESE